MSHFTSFFFKFKFNLLAKIFFFLLHTAFAMAILDLSSRVHRALFVIMLLKQLKHSTCSTSFWSIIICNVHVLRSSILRLISCAIHSFLAHLSSFPTKSLVLSNSHLLMLFHCTSTFPLLHSIAPTTSVRPSYASCLAHVSSPNPILSSLLEPYNILQSSADLCMQLPGGTISIWQEEYAHPSYCLLFVDLLVSVATSSTIWLYHCCRLAKTVLTLRAVRWWNSER
jgi:hypothetical protein